MKKIYLAGPWFNPEQEERHTRIYNLLIELGYEVFNPKLESLIDENSNEDKLTQTLIGNIDGVIDADLVVALVDKPYDSGTVWECGLAYGKTPVLYYAEKLNGKPFNLMLAKTGEFADTEKRLAFQLKFESTWEIQIDYQFDGEIE